MTSFFSMIWSWLKGLYESIIRKITGQEPQPENPLQPEDPFIPDIDRPAGPGEIVCYYGCPNSKNAQKLQLSKKLYR